MIITTILIVILKVIITFVIVTKILLLMLQVIVRILISIIIITLVRISPHSPAGEFQPHLRGFANMWGKSGFIIGSGLRLKIYSALLIELFIDLFSHPCSPKRGPRALRSH